MNHLEISRRQALATGIVGVITAATGCAGLGDGAESSTRKLRLTLSHQGGTLRDQFVVDLSDTEQERDDEAFKTVLAGGSYTTQGSPPFVSHPRDPTYTRHQGTYYRLSSYIVDETSVTRPVLRLFEVESTSSDSTDAVAASELPALDQRAVKIAYMAARARGNPGGVPWGLVRRGGYVYGEEEAIEASRLLSEESPKHVQYRDSTYRVEVSNETFYEPVHKATVVALTDSPKQMEAILRARFVDARVSSDDLSSEARDIIETARMESYSEAHPYSEGYQEVLRQLHKRAYIDGNIQKDAGVSDEQRHILLYDGLYYDHRLQFVTEENNTD